MPLSNVTTDALAKLRSLADRGDETAKVIVEMMNGTNWPSLTAATEGSNIIRVAGQIKDQDGQAVASVKNVRVRAKLALGTAKTEVVVATAAALPAVTAAGTGVGHTLTADAVGVLTVDGVAVASGDRILVKDQVATDDNGIYTLTTVGTGGVAFVLTRATDFDALAEMPYGSNVFVRTGKANAGKTFVLTSTVVTVDTTGLTFTDLDTLITLGIGAAGATIKSGTGTRDLWLQTASTGAFSVDVTSVAAWVGDVLLEATVDNGETELAVLTFA
jgi:hypothetical protein